MKTYSTTYKFEKNGISYESKITGIIFNKANDVINFYHIPDTLKKGFAMMVANAVTNVVNNNNDTTMFINAQLMQSNVNEAYAVLIDRDFYPISINVSIEVVSNPFELLR